MSYFLGLDTSTTATKALLLDGDGRVVEVAASAYSYESPHPLWSEQDPDRWWQAAAASIQKVLGGASAAGDQIEAVGLTGQMHGLVLLDRPGEVLRPAILWNDQRTANQCDQIRRRIGAERLIQITGNDALTGFTAPKLLWVRDEEPDIYGQIAHILLPKDFVRLMLTGEYASDRAGGSGTILFDLRERDWSQEILGELEIAPDWLPPTFEGTEITGVVSETAAAATGLRAGTPVVAGGGDQSAAAVGTGAVSQGVVSLSLGTSGVVFATVDRPLIEPQGRLHAFCHAVPGKWHVMGVMLSAAGSLRWYRDTFEPGLGYPELLAPAARVAPGSDGLLFLPYLTGERTPHPDPLARGAFVGLTSRHGRPHLARAVLEGVGFGMRDIFELMADAGIPQARQVRVTGGGARSELWLQVLADVLKVDLHTVTSEEGAAHGAALLAAVGAGHFQDVQSAAERSVGLDKQYSPGPASDRYDELYRIYRSLYPALRSSFSALSEA